MEKERMNTLALRVTEGLSTRKILELIEAYGTAGEVLRAPAGELEKKFRVAGAAARALRNQRALRKAESEWRALEKISARVLILQDPDYPRLLREIYDPPPVLFYQGEWREEDEIALAVVGSRNAGTAGVAIAGKFSGALSGMGFTIVSGLARGIDTAAHEAALEAGGRTIAVLGAGLDVPYPKGNVRLKRRIAGQGVVVTEYPLSTSPLPPNFPVRNRIISGLTLGTMVVEAAARSGSLITARHALEQGREVFAVPGSVLSGGFKGCNTLIQEGAKLVMGPEDIVEEFPEQVRRRLRRRDDASPQERYAALTPEERRVVELIREHAPVHIDCISEHLRIRIAELSHMLLALEMKKLIRQMPGKIFVSN